MQLDLHFLPTQVRSLMGWYPCLHLHLIASKKSHSVATEFRAHDPKETEVTQPPIHT